MFTFTANEPAPAGGRHLLSMEKKGRSASVKTRQEAKKMAPVREPEKTQLPGAQHIPGEG